MSRFNHPLSLDATIIGEHVIIILVTQQITMVTVWPASLVTGETYFGTIFF